MADNNNTLLKTAVIATAATLSAIFALSTVIASQNVRSNIRQQDVVAHPDYYRTYTDCVWRAIPAFAQAATPGTLGPDIEARIQCEKDTNTRIRDRLTIEATGSQLLAGKFAAALGLILIVTAARRQLAPAEARQRQPF